MNHDISNAIADANNRFMACVADTDKDGFTALYTQDAVLMLPNMASLSGHAGVRQFFDGLKAKGISNIKLTTQEVEACGDTAWERGSAQSLLADGTVAGRSKYIVIWKNVDGRWLLHRDIMNADPAAES